MTCQVFFYHTYKCPTVLSRSCGQLRFKEFITIFSLPRRADGRLIIILFKFGLLLPSTLYMIFSEKDSLTYSSIQSSPLYMLPNPFSSWDWPSLYHYESFHEAARMSQDLISSLWGVQWSGLVAIPLSAFQALSWDFLSQHSGRQQLANPRNTSRILSNYLILLNTDTARKETCYH